MSERRRPRDWTQKDEDRYWEERDSAAQQTRPSTQSTRTQQLPDRTRANSRARRSYPEYDDDRRPINVPSAALTRRPAPGSLVSGPRYGDDYADAERGGSHDAVGRRRSGRIEDDKITHSGRGRSERSLSEERRHDERVARAQADASRNTRANSRPPRRTSTFRDEDRHLSNEHIRQSRLPTNDAYFKDMPSRSERQEEYPRPRSQPSRNRGYQREDEEDDERRRRRRKSERRGETSYESHRRRHRSKSRSKSPSTLERLAKGVMKKGKDILGL